MALRRLPENPRQQARAWNLQLGVPGFKYADLNRVRPSRPSTAPSLPSFEAPIPRLLKIWSVIEIRAEKTTMASMNRVC